jgi:hypothetical protein
LLKSCDLLAGVFAEVEGKSLGEAARIYAEAGIQVFPVLPGRKDPATAHGFKDATIDPAQIAAWWPAGDPDPCNIGICPDHVGCAVLDVERDGQVDLINLQMENQVLPDTLEVHSASGGRHLWLAGSVKSTQKKLAPTIDTRGIGGYVLAPPSWIDERDPKAKADPTRCGVYRLTVAAPPAEVPGWVVERLGATAKPPREAAVAMEDREPQTLARVIELLSWLDPTNRDDWIKVCGAIKGTPLLNGANAEVAEQWARGEFDRWGRYAAGPPASYDPDDTMFGGGARWEGLDGRAGFPTLVWMAEQAQRKASDVFDDVGDDPKGTPAAPRFLTDDGLLESDFQPPEYVWQHMILRRHVNLLYGDGKVGKTMLALHLALAIAAGIVLFGHATKRLPVLMVLGEDDYGAIKASRVQIARALGIDQTDLDIRYVCRPGDDLTIARVNDDGTAVKGAFADELIELVKAAGPECVVFLDNASIVADGAYLPAPRAWRLDAGDRLHAYRAGASDRGRDQGRRHWRIARLAQRHPQPAVACPRRRH